MNPAVKLKKIISVKDVIMKAVSEMNVDKDMLSTVEILNKTSGKTFLSKQNALTNSVTLTKQRCKTKFVNYIFMNSGVWMV